MRKMLAAAALAAFAGVATGDPRDFRVVWIDGVDRAENSVSVELDAERYRPEGSAYFIQSLLWQNYGSVAYTAVPDMKRTRRDRRGVTTYSGSGRVRDHDGRGSATLKARWVGTELRSFALVVRGDKRPWSLWPGRYGLKSVTRADVN